MQRHGVASVPPRELMCTWATARAAPGCNLLVAYSAFHMEQRDGNTGTQGIKVRYVDLDPAGSAPAIAPRPQRAPLPWALVSVFAALSLLVVGRVACRMRL